MTSTSLTEKEGAIETTMTKMIGKEVELRAREETRVIKGKMIGTTNMAVKSKELSTTK